MDRSRRPCRGDRFRRAVRQFVASELFFDKSVVRRVVVKRVDDVLTVLPGLRLLAVAFVTVGFGEADQIEPVPTPLLAVATSQGTE